MPETVISKHGDGQADQSMVGGPRLKSISWSSAAPLTESRAQVFAADYRIHKEMMKSSVTSTQARPIVYVRTPLLRTHSTFNSSQSNVSAAALSHYENVERNLTQLLQDPEGDERIEKGAVSSALSVVAELRRHELPPPELSWHGGDAVVMLWALGDTTYAITVTDGELGYVVRRNRKAVKIADSFAVSNFKIEDMR